MRGLLRQVLETLSPKRQLEEIRFGITDTLFDTDGSADDAEFAHNFTLGSLACLKENGAVHG